MRILALDNNKSIELKTLEESLSYIKKKQLVWIDLEKPTYSEIEELEKLFKFHPLTIEDCMSNPSIPKLDVYKSYVFIAMNRVDFKANSIKVGDIFFYLSKYYLISVHVDESRTVQDVYSKLLNDSEIFKRGTDFVLYELMWRVIERYNSVLEQMEDVIQNLESKLLKGKLTNSLTEIIKMRRTLVSFRKSLIPQKDLILKFARRDTDYIQFEHIMYFRDVADDLNRALSSVDSLREIITGTFEAYLSIYSNKLNEVMKTLTVIATIFLPLTFLTGVYGMNFKFFPELESPGGYQFFWLICVVVSIVMLFYFKKKGYL